MKEIGPIAGINCKNTMTKISHAKGTDHQDITKINIKESTLNSVSNKVAFNEKSAITKENLCTKYFPFTYKYVILNKKLPIMKENLCIFFFIIGGVEGIIIHFKTIEIGENIKKVIKTSIGKKIINIRKGLEIIMKMSMKTGTIGMNMNTNTEMKAVICPLTFMNYCDTFMVIHPCMIQNDSFLKTNQYCINT